MEPPTRFVIEEPGVVRATIARAILEVPQKAVRQIGQIHLQAHQVSAVTRIRASLGEFRCAILCDPVGTGKTYTALAAASRFKSVIIIAPAVLKSMWIESARLAGTSVSFVSFESLSRGRVPAGRFDFVIVDEAHHARNPNTRRYRMLSEVARSAEVLLISATPIHNTRRDLISLLSICLGSRAHRLSTAALASCIIRRDALVTSVAGMPVTRPMVWCKIRESERIPSLIMTLPPPVPPSDGGDGGVLVAHSLIRQWSSSDSALRGALRRRLVRAEALIAALEDGAWPSRVELQSWIVGDDSVQLALPGMLAAVTGQYQALIHQVRIHSEGVRNLLKECEGSSSDTDRADLIRRMRIIHHDRRIVLFSQFADSISGLFALLVKDGGVAALSGSSAAVAGGSITRDEAISRFAPRANGRPEPPESQAVTLLLTTDILSEGVNLQDAGVVVHLDLPWTPARMEQRLGRVARIGSRHDDVISYAIAPPIKSQELVRIDEILRAKLNEASAVSVHFESLASLAPSNAARSIPTITESIRQMLGTWTSESPDVDAGTIPVASVESLSQGFLAVCKEGERRFLIASLSGELTDDVERIESLLPTCDGKPLCVSNHQFESALRRVDEWLYARGAVTGARRLTDRRDAGIRLALRRIDRAVKTAKTADRIKVAALAQRARSALAAKTGAHFEREIGSMAASNDSDIELLKRLSDLATGSEGHDDSGNTRIIGLLLLVKQERCHR